MVQWVLGSDSLDSLWRRAQCEGDGDIFQRLLQALEIDVDCGALDLKRIPKRGPVVIAANHPFGLLDGVVLGAILGRVRPDFRILANAVLCSAPALGEYMLPVDVFGGSVHENGKSLRSAYRWLKEGGALVVFPAGEVSSINGLGIADREWNSAAFELASRAAASVVPAFLHGHNGAAFQLAGLIHPILRTVMLGRELLNKRKSRVEVSIGTRIPPARLRDAGDSNAMAGYVRKRTYALGYRTPVDARQEINECTVAVAVSVPAVTMEREIAALPAESHLFSRGDFDVFYADARQIPACLREIARLRELTFRAAGEGTGRELDLDRFDDHYRHLFLWNRTAREVVGAYRIADSEAVLAAHGAGGFYTRTLFRLEPDLLRRLSPGLELGRSFIRAEYQKQIHPLSYLWKGIGRVLAQRPGIRYLFGPVSISADYSTVARELIVAYFNASRDGNWVKPRNKARPRLLRNPSVLSLAREVRSAAELSDLISDLQPDGRDLPVLFRHYLNLGAKVLGFNVDPAFSNTLDALIVVDLQAAPPEVLQRYTGIAA